MPLLKKDDKEYPLVSGTGKVLLGGVGAIPGTVANAVTQPIRAGVGMLINAVPEGPINLGARESLNLASEGVGELKTGVADIGAGLRRAGQKARTGAMSALGLVNAPTANAATVPTSSGVTSAQLPQTSVNPPAKAAQSFTPYTPKLLPATKKIVGGVQPQITTQEFYRSSGGPETEKEKTDRLAEREADAALSDRLREETDRIKFQTDIGRLVDEALMSEPKYSKSYYQDKDTGEWLMQEGKHYGVPKNKETLKYVSDLMALKGGTVGGVTETNARRDVARLGLKGTETTAKLGLEGHKAQAEALVKGYGLRAAEAREQAGLKREELALTREANTYNKEEDRKQKRLKNTIDMINSFSPEILNEDGSKSKNTDVGLWKLIQSGEPVPDELKGYANSLHSTFGDWVKKWESKKNGGRKATPEDIAALAPVFAQDLELQRFRKPVKK